MSIAGRDGTSRSFAVSYRNGFEARYECTNPPTNTTGAIIHKQTRSSKTGANTSILVQAALVVKDPTTGESFPVTANFTMKWPNTLGNPSSTLQEAAILVFRSVYPAEAATIVGTATETNLKNLQIGVMAAP